MIYARYTIVLKSLLDNKPTREVIEKAMSTYPLYEPKSENKYIPNWIPTRSQLNQKILNRYKYCEIGFESVGRFIDELEIALNEIMPFYNQLFFSTDWDYNPIFNVDYQKTFDTIRNTQDDGTVDSSMSGSEKTSASSDTTSTSNDTNSSTSSMTTNGKAVNSDTPQSQLNITAKNIDGVTYADNVNWNNNESSSTNTSNGNTSNVSNSDTSSNVEQTNELNTTTTNKQEQTEKTLETTKGNFGVVSSQDLLLKYRETIMNIEQDIINDKRIRELFMYIY